jgi:hypothetical protein
MFHNVYVSKNMKTKQGQQGRIALDESIPPRPSNTGQAAIGLAARSPAEHQTKAGMGTRQSTDVRLILSNIIIFSKMLVISIF